MKKKLQKMIMIIIIIILYEGFIESSLINNKLIAQVPSIEFTHIPAWGTNEKLTGKVSNVIPDSFKIAVYIFVEGVGWWTKPTFANPLTTIDSNSEWSCNTVTGGSDEYATKFCAFLLPNGVFPPKSAGLSDLPVSLDTISVAKACTERCGKIIKFSGYDWCVKASAAPVGPGPNYFSDIEENVWVDSLGRLHLKITNKNGIWYCPEVINQSSLGYGKYEFQIIGSIGRMDQNVVLGLFTWDNSAEEFHKEIDIEFSRWSDSIANNAQYVIQPYTNSENINKWLFPLYVDSSTHSFNWSNESINFLSYKGFPGFTENDSSIFSWQYRGENIPTPGNENIRINLWLFNGIAPSDSQEVEVIINKFEYFGLIDIEEKVTTLNPALSISPNPANDKISIEYHLNSIQNTEIIITNELGIECAKFSNSDNLFSTEGTIDFDTINLASGVYFCTLKCENYVETIRFFIVK